MKTTIRTIVALQIAILLGMPGYAEDAPDSPLPETTPQALAEPVGKSRESYRRGLVEVLYRDRRSTNPFVQDAEPVMVDFHGRFRYASDGTKWHGEFDGKTYRSGSTELTPRGWTAGYDGKMHYAWERPNGGMTLGKIQAHENIPTEIFFWSSHGTSFGKSLKTNEWEMVDKPIVEGYRCYHLRREFEANKSLYRYELVISPRQSYLPVSYSVSYNDMLSWSHTLKRLEKSPTGHWYPTQVIYKDTYSKRDYDARVRTFEPDYEFPKLVETEVPLGVHVRDNLTGRIYINDPWWPEIGAFMNNEFKWPPVDLTPLRNAQSYCDPSIDGVDAIPLNPAHWIQGEPLTLADRKGKVTLLRFSSASLHDPAPAQTAALRHLYEKFKPNGLEVIEICYDGLAPAQIKSEMAELKVPWPVVLDEESKGYGKTFDVYKLKASVSWILIDKESKVRTVSDGTLAKQLMELLADSSDAEVPKIHFEFVEQPRELGQAVQKFWKAHVGRAPVDSTIRGTTVRGDQPLAGVKISAELRLRFSGSAHSLSATSIVPFPTYTYKTESDAEGNYELKNLVKGTYRVTFVLPGGQSIQREISVGGKDKPAVYDLDVSN